MVLTHLVMFSFLNGASASGVVTPPAPGIPDSPHYTPLVAPADWRADEDAFSPEARLEVLADDLEDLERFIGEVEAAGDEFVDPWENEINHDLKLMKLGRRGR